jgi:hypothetical protein
LYKDGTPNEDEINLREYILVLLRKWWVVVGFTLLALAATWITLPKASVVYETRASLLLESSADLESNGNSGIGLFSTTSSDALALLAKGNDLLLNIIATVKLEDQISGEEWTTGRLSTMMDVSVESDSGDVGQSLISMVVRGVDPLQIQQIADVWAEEFGLMANLDRSGEVDRGYSLVSAQMQESRLELNSAETELNQFLLANPLIVLKNDLGLKQAGLNTYRSELMNTTAEVNQKKKAYQRALNRLNDLSVDGNWIGSYMNIEASASASGSSAETGEQALALQVRNDLLEIQESMQRHKSESGIDFLKQRLGLSKESFSEYRLQLNEEERLYQADQIILETYETALAIQPQMLVTFRAIDDSTLWERLGKDPTPDDWEKVRELGLHTEQVNPAYTSLVSNIITSKASFEARRVLIDFLNSRMDLTALEINELQLEVTLYEEVILARLLNDQGVAQQRYNEEFDKFVVLRNNVDNLSNEIDSLDGLIEGYTILVDNHVEDLTDLSIRVPATEKNIAKSEANVKLIQDVIDNLEVRLRLLDQAGPSQSDAVYIVESPIRPSVPMPSTSTRRSRLPIVGALGLVLGIVAAFGIEYAQRFVKPANESK